ncbi:MAG TPA: cytochrome c [Lacunisphaera sp.]|nr:cytochrome c [Lacunisphaera sp.]
MRRVAGLILISALAACSKQEQPPDTAPASATVADPVAPAAPPSQAEAEPAPPSPATLKPGEQIFNSTCATCHMADGGGVPHLQPSIIGSAWISNPDPQLLLSLILRGSAILGEASQAYANDMAPQEHLGDAEIAAVATYVRSRFAATPIEQPVTPAEVAVARKRPGLPE